MAIGAMVFGPHQIWFWTTVGALFATLFFLEKSGRFLVKLVERLAMTVSHLLVLTLLLVLYFFCLTPLSLAMIFRSERAAGRKQSESPSANFFERPY